MDDEFESRLVYSSDSDDDELDKDIELGSVAQPQSLDEQIDNILAEVERRPSIIEDDEPLFTTKAKKSNKILSSDEDSDVAAVQPESDGEIEKLDSGDEATAQIESVQEAPTTIRSALWDSDTKSDDDQAKDEPVRKAKKKVLKKKKKNDVKKRIVGGEDSESSSSDASDDKQQKESSQRSKGSSQSSSDTDEEATPNDNVPLPPREKAKQRMSAKVAGEQIKEIQSESQRLARQLYINVPYHKPKQHSLKEFLNRRSLTKQQEILTRLPTKKAAAAIKMSAEELQIYAETLEQRAQEAIEFFQNEDDEPKRQQSSDGSNDDEAKKTAQPTEKPGEIVEAIESQDTVENRETENKKPESFESVEATAMDVENSDTVNVASVEPNTGPIVEPVEETVIIRIDEQTGSPVKKQSEMIPKPSSIDIILHTEKTELDLELDNMISDENKRKKLLALSLPLDVSAAPKLIGDKDMIIDLDSNEVKPREKSGVEELQERFIRHAMKKPKTENQSSELSVFNTEIGGLESMSHFSETVVKSDPKPGQAFLKLKNEFGKKISERRREIMLKRIEDEKQKRLEMESDDDEEELGEYSDCGAGESDQEVTDGVEVAKEPTEEEEGEMAGGSELEEEPHGNEFIDSEAEDDVDENENESSAESESETNEEAVTNTNKTKRSRIIAAFEDDSGDEMPPPNGQTSIAALETSVRSLDDSAIDQSFGESAQPASTQIDEAKRQAIIEDMNEFESRLLDTNTQAELPRSETTTAALFPDEGDAEEIGESQLMALCSGAFVTQQPEEIVNEDTSNSAVPETASEMVNEKVLAVDLKAALLSSDEENIGEGDEQLRKKKKKSKKNKNKKLDYSDDENDDNLDEAADEEVEEEELAAEDEEVDLGERYVEYDSDENEIEVQVPRKEMRKKASEFVEQEAELSESEWGSADEDEKGMDAYDADLLNDEEFDQQKLQSELERIRMRQQIDQDAREVRILKEMYIEDEDDAGQRERKFRWKNIDNIDPSAMQASVDNDVPVENEEDENEEEWRRLRYEREQLLLKQTNLDGNAESAPTTEGNQDAETVPMTTNAIASIFRRTPILTKTINTPQTSSPFLINQSASMSAHVVRKSFLNRNEKILEKLANLTKASGDGETVKSSTATRGGNYVFVATEKTFAAKRKSDSEQTVSENNPSKKTKGNEVTKNERGKTSLGILEILSK